MPPGPHLPHLVALRQGKLSEAQRRLDAAHAALEERQRARQSTVAAVRLADEKARRAQAVLTDALEDGATAARLAAGERRAAQLREALGDARSAERAAQEQTAAARRALEREQQLVEAALRALEAVEAELRAVEASQRRSRERREQAAADEAWRPTPRR